MSMPVHLPAHILSIVFASKETWYEKLKLSENENQFHFLLLLKTSFPILAFEFQERMDKIWILQKYAITLDDMS